jgi:nucleoside-diphosphate-sugar epimerase
VLRAVGRDLPIVTEAQRLRPGASEVERLRGDATRAHALLGWSPAVSLDEGIDRVVAYVRANLPRYKPEVYAV